MNWVSIASGKVRHQAIAWTNADSMSIVPSGKNVSEIQTKIQMFSHWKCMSKYRLRNGDHIVQGGGGGGGELVCCYMLVCVEIFLS